MSLAEGTISRSSARGCWCSLLHLSTSLAAAPAVVSSPDCMGSREGPKLQNPNSSFPPHLGLCEASTLSWAGAGKASTPKHPSSALSHLHGLK